MSQTQTRKLEEIRAQLPESAKDTKLNLQRVLEAQSLSQTQRQLIALSCAYATRSIALIAAMTEFCDDIATSSDTATEDSIGSVQVKSDAIAVASLMAMNNIFYRFKHLAGSEDYAKAPAGLRMNQIAKPQTDKLHFELASIAVSAMNGCQNCIKSHDASIKKHGGTSDQVLDAIRIAAVISATASLEFAYR